MLLLPHAIPLYHSGRKTTSAGSPDPVGLLPWKAGLHFLLPGSHVTLHYYKVFYLLV